MSRSSVLLLSIFTPWAIADDVPTGGRYRVRPREAVRAVAAGPEDFAAARTESTAERRWEEVKARHAPKVPAEANARPKPAEQAPSIPQSKPGIVPIPEDQPAELPADEPVAEDDFWPEAEESVADESESTVETADTMHTEPPPIGDFGEEPAWIYGLTPEPEGEEPPPATAQRDLAPLGDGAAAEGKAVEEAPPANAPETSQEPLKMKPPRKPRKIQEISPKYDLSLDQDIREFAAQQARQYDVQFSKETFPQRNFPGLVYNWEASNFHYLPLYFEDPQLERYGHTYPCYLQPAASIARFSTQLIGMPYQMVIDPPCCPRYALGWYRPGDVAPKLCYQIPWNTKAALTEAGVITGAFFIIP